MEAVIELSVAESETLPRDTRAAISSLFAVPQGQSNRLDESRARELGANVLVSFQGIDRNDAPTICVQDKGIGIHSSDFPDSILALGQSDKGQKPYLVGMYGHGGSSTFDRCEYTIIVSRRHPNFLQSDQVDQVGWTVVRRRLSLRTNVYSYLVDPETKTVPAFEGSIADEIGFSFGTRVSHVGYRGTGAFATQAITNRAFFTLNYRLLDPLLPWTLVDNRGSTRVSRTMRGVPYRIAQLATVGGVGSTESRQRDDSTAVRHHVDYKHELPYGSHLRVKWWILQDERILEGRYRPDHASRLRPYIDPTRRYARRVIAVTRGGQTHAGLTSNSFSRRGLRQLARSTFVQVDTDNLTYEEGASFFASNRAELKTASQDLIEEAVNAAIDLYIDDLRGIEREREQEIVSGRTASDEDAIRRHLDRMISEFDRSLSGSGSEPNLHGRRNGTFRGRRIPTFLRFARRRLLEIRPGRPTHIDILTDASDQVMRSRGTQFRIQSDDGEIKISSPEGHSGRFRVSLHPSASIPTGTQARINASISQPGAWHRAAEPLRVHVVPPPPPYEGQFPPTVLSFRSQNGTVRVRQGGSRVSIVTDARNDVIENGATFTVVSSDQSVLAVSGWSGPKDGEFRIGLRIPESVPTGPAGEISASLTMNDGSRLAAHANLHVDPKLEHGGQSQLRSQPNYEIKDVKQIPIEGDEISWQDMPNILSVDKPWNHDDVGAFLRTGNEGSKMITFYLNRDNAKLRTVERHLARTRSENAVDDFREMHRTLLCFHLYELATRDQSDEISEYDYRDEIIRVNQSLLFMREEFLEARAN